MQWDGRVGHWPPPPQRPHFGFECFGHAQHRDQLFKYWPGSAEKKQSILENPRISTFPKFYQTKKLTSKSLNKYSTMFRKDEIIQCWDLLLQTRKVDHEN